MSNAFQICPYPGLRPFNEDEAIYFKGRDSQIEKIVQELQDKKFLMVTGASGDGKSSLIYAGVIPYAKGGFFKAKYNKWIVADFRPERSPLKNLANALSINLKKEDEQDLEKELGYGFSALIDLYKNSPYYIDTSSEEWINSDKKTKTEQGNKASNLLILVDQFEEFFTNPENYINGNPSVESQKVLNLLLETYKIAKEQDIPLYVVCTMRSDYIGQCASFRGLPEAIGYSQFFVPRLKRQEIQQVIEDPAILSGNRISKRLVQKLLNNLPDGFDQLPLLQHALNHLWKAAENGQEEIDILHLAKIGGISPKQLSKEDRPVFDSWIGEQSEFKKLLLQNPSISNILDAHARELFESANLLVQKNYGLEIPKEETRLIIKTTFSCLTKIDVGRAVRNRMTLQEIVAVINNPSITLDKVRFTLNIFREQGNTFLKPFITEDKRTFVLPPESVLDITHESLIRNWKMLEQWTREEHENHIVYLDFYNQLQRWVNDRKSHGHLLPIGPLTFFEKWYNDCRPNKNWLVKYDDRELPVDQKLEEATIILEDARELLEKSSKKLFFSKLVLKHGANKVAASIGFIILVVSCIYFYLDFRTKQNDYVIEEIKSRGLEMLESPKVDLSTKADFVINHERLDSGSFENILNGLENDTLAFDIAFEMFGKIVNKNQLSGENEKIDLRYFDIINFLNERLETLMDKERLKKKSTLNFSRLNSFLSICAYLKINTKTSSLDKLIDQKSWALNEMLHRFFQFPNDSNNINPVELNNGIQLLIGLSPKIDFSFYITKLSTNKQSELKLQKLFPQNNLLSNFAATEVPYNGRFELLSQLLATQKEIMISEYEEMLHCVDSNSAKQPEYYFEKYKFGNSYSLINTLIYYGNFSQPAAYRLLSIFSLKSSILSSIYLDNLINSSFHSSLKFSDIIPINSKKIYPNYARFFINKDQWKKIWVDYSASRSFEQLYFQPDNYNGDDLENFHKAIFYKKKGAFYSEILKEQKQGKEFFEKALFHFEKVNVRFLQTEFHSSYLYDGLPAAYLFLYPESINHYSFKSHKRKDFLEEFASQMNYSAKSFNQFILRNKNSLQQYLIHDRIKILEDFCYENFNNNYSKDSSFYYCLNLILNFSSNNSELKKFLNFSFLQLAVINSKIEVNDPDAFNLIRAFDLKKIFWSEFFDSKEFPFRNKVHYQIIQNIINYLVKQGKLEDSFKWMSQIPFEETKRNFLINCAFNLNLSGPSENSFIYLDSLFKNNDINQKPKFGTKLIQVLALIGTRQTLDLATDLIKDLDEISKPRAMALLIKGMAMNGYYYNALRVIPPYFSSNMELKLYNEILESHIDYKTKSKWGEEIKWKKSNETIYGGEYEIERGSQDKIFEFY